MAQTAQTSDTRAVRGVSDAEIDDFRENGWAMLRHLITAEHAAELLRLGQEKLGEDGSARTNTPDSDHNRAAFAKWYHLDRESELYRDLRTNSVMGRNAALLLGQDMPIRSLTMIVACKLPQDAAVDRGNQETRLHQDQMSTPAKCATLAYWIALNDMTPEMGTMNFFNGSHKLGLLMPPLERWPRLYECPVASGLHMEAGDASVHSSLVAHNAPTNNTDTPRWSLIINYFPAEAPYYAYPTKHTDGIEHLLTPGKPLDHEYFPLAYTPDNWSS